MYNIPIDINNYRYLKMRKETQKVIHQIQVFKNHNGILRFNQALNDKVHPSDLAEMKKSGLIEQLGRGLYRLAKLPPLSNPDLTTVSLKIPQGVICLISALDFHNITTQVPHKVDVALKAGAEKPSLDYPSTQFYWFSGPAFKSGVETHEVDGTPIRVYSAPKTVVDCFKFRNRVGIDVAIEALKLYRETRGFTVDQISQHARICRMERIMRPYLEAIL